ncbi:hypothetical protein BJV78DRAFT_1171370 [Lactifluus subvellereus]|nr:hypothetical protein BJV78DRAFT_1171370 [Lactifluus subvellereus]
MSKDLHLVGLRYNTAAAVFFVPYCLVEVPSCVCTSLSGRGAKTSSAGISFSSYSDHPDGFLPLW